LKSTSHVPIDRSDWWDSLTWSEGIFIKNQATRAYFKRGNQSYSEQRFLIFFQDSFLSGHLHIISPFDAPIHYEGRTYKKNDIITFNIARDEHGAKGLLNNAVVFINDNPKRIFIPSSHMQKLHLITTLEHSVNDKSFSFFKSESHSHLTKADVQLRHSLYKCLNESSAPGSAVFVDGNLDDRPGSTILTFPVDDGTGYLKCSYHKGASHTYVYTASLDRLVLELRGKSLSHFKITSADGIITTLSDGALNLNLHKRKMWVYISFEDDHIMVSGRKHCR
jgi:hypothetical protein